MAKKWISIWDMPHIKGGLIPANYARKTCRLVVSTNVSGTAVRIKLNNERGTSYIRLNSASVCLCDKNGNFTDSPVRLTFEGKYKVILSAGKTLVSDDVKLNVPAGSKIAVSMYFDSRSHVTSGNYTSDKFLISKNGDYTLKSVIDCNSTAGKLAGMVKRISSPKQTHLSPCGIISEVQLFNEERSKTSSVVLLSDGTGSGAGLPEQLADMFSEKYPGKYQLIDSTVKNGRLIYDCIKNRGKSGINRVEEDAFSTLGVSHIILMMGKNDIILPGTSDAPKSEAVIAQQIVNSYKDIIARAHERGIKVIGVTLPPIDCCDNYGEELENRRANVNKWLRAKGQERFDKVIDIASVLESEKKDGAHKQEYYTDKGEINISGVNAIVEQFSSVKKLF